MRALGGGDASGVHGEGPTQGWGARARAERTANMAPMFVTLEVSKLSGWLNDDASCRESNGGHTIWGEVQSTGRPEAAGDRGARGVRGRARLQIGDRRAVERTRNMYCMSVTLEVSQLETRVDVSSWLGDLDRRADVWRKRPPI